MKKRVLFGIILFVLLLNCVSAATIYGTIYDFSLNRAKNVIVEINSSPHQRQVAVNGTYEFTLIQGDYTISTSLKEGSTTMRAIENISIIDDGNYLLDLFLYPNLDDVDSLYESPNIDVPILNAGQFNYFIIIIPLAAVMIVFLIIMMTKIGKLGREELKVESNILNADLKEVIAVIKNNGGRATQKEIRKSIAYSEAKISLMLTELEALGYISRIKKGRGNLIVLSKGKKL
jgi:uncharacterized membrane protein